MHYYDHHIGDFRAATAFLPDALQYAYLKLLWVYYDTELPLPNKPRLLSLRAGVSEEDLALILDEFFDLESDGNWHHARCNQELGAYRRHREGSSKGGKKRAANARRKQGALDEPIKGPSAPAQATSNQEPVITTCSPNGFDEFWNVYPRKVGKKKAATAWKNLTKKNQGAAMVDCQVRFLATSKKFIPYPATYLHGENWNDELPEAETDWMKGAV